MFPSSAWSNDNDVIFTDVQYNEHALVHNVKTKDGVSEILNKLFSKQRHRHFSISTSSGTPFHYSLFALSPSLGVKHYNKLVSWVLMF